MKNIKFQKNANDTKFLNELRIRVNAYFKCNELHKTANRKASIKALVLLAIYFAATISIFTASSFAQLLFAYAIVGMSTIFVALNLAHDAAHNTFAKSKKINNLLLYTFDMLGASGYMWRLKHVFSHHPHVNIPDMDGDIKQSKLVRIFPNAPRLSLHKYQHYYMPILYMFYTLIWLLVRDFRDYFDTDISGKQNLRHTKKEYIKLFMGKTLFFGRMLILPYWLLPFSFGQIFLGFLCFHFVASLTVALPLVSAHVGEHAQYPEPDVEGNMPSSWVRHQLVTTTDFATNSPVVTHLFGGFNHHVVHHLFPTICHIHYPKLTKILKETCKEFDMPYASNPSLPHAIWSHLKFLRIRSKEGKRPEYIDM